MTMTNFDFSPLYRTTVGFDHLSTLLDNIHRSDRAANSYPPYNIELISERFTTSSMKVKRLLDPDFNDEVFIKIILTLAFCTSNDGFIKLRATLLNY